MIVEGDKFDEFFRDEEMITFVAELTPTYLLCGVRDAASIRSNLKDANDVFQKLPAGPSAFTCCTLMNNHDLWTSRCKNEHDRDHDCHGTKGEYTQARLLEGVGTVVLSCVDGTRRV